MSFYQQVDRGALKATMVLAVPRSVSSALTKALSASPDFQLYIFQPFYLSQDSRQELDGYIQNAMQDHNASSDSPLSVIMKVMAESVSGQRFYHLKNHCDNIAVLVRDPQSQALSAFRAYHQKKSGKDKNSNELAELKTMRSLKKLEEYVVIPWERMEKHVNQLSDASEGRGENPRWCALDGDIMRAAPEMMLKRLCSDFDITYSPHMVEGWNTEEEKTVGLKGKGYHQAWLGRVQHTSGLRKPSAMTPRLEDFSRPVRAQIEANLRTYVKILAQPEAMLPAPQELRQLMEKEDFAHTCPIACYTMVALWPDEFSHMRSQTLASIRAQESAYTSSFDLIDSVVSREPCRQRHAVQAQQRAVSASR